MRIAQITSLSEKVPPKKYGGTERVIYELTEELVARGHEVTLFASGDSKTSARLISVLPKALRDMSVKNPYGLNEWNLLNIGLAYQMQSEFDIIHDHNYAISLPVANVSSTPVVQTIHGCFHESNIPLYSLLDNIHVVAISHMQKKLAQGKVRVADTIYNGLTMNTYPFSARHDGYLLYIGRMSPEKGVHHAVEVAKRLDVPIIIGGRVAEHEQEYFNTHIRPHIKDPRVMWVGEVNEQERNVLMSHALGMLHPVTWPEPFGLTMIEAMACGCPVIGFNQGSIPEIIEDGKTGYVVNSVDEMASAVKMLHLINRSYCRSYALSTFNARTMTDGYEALYKKITDHKKIKSQYPIKPITLQRLSAKLKKIEA